MHFSGRNHSRLSTMQPKKSDRRTAAPLPDLIDQLDPRNHLLGLAKAIPWQVLRTASSALRCIGRPAKPVRLMVGLLILKQLKTWAMSALSRSGFRTLLPGLLRSAAVHLEAAVWSVRADLFSSSHRRRRCAQNFWSPVTLHGDKAKEEEVRGLHRAGKEHYLSHGHQASDQDRDALPHHGQTRRRQTPAQLSAWNQKAATDHSLQVRRNRVRPASCQAFADYCRRPDPRNEAEALPGSSWAPTVFGPLRPRYSASSVPTRVKFTASTSQTFPASAKERLTRNTSSAPRRPWPADQDQRHRWRIVPRTTPSMVISPRSAWPGRKYRGPKANHGDLWPWISRQASNRDDPHQIPESGTNWTWEAQSQRALSPQGRHRTNHRPSQKRSPDAWNYLKGRIGDSVNLFMACAAFNFRKFIRILYFLCLKLLGHVFRPDVRSVQAYWADRFWVFQDRLIHPLTGETREYFSPGLSWPVITFEKTGHLVSWISRPSGKPPERMSRVALEMSLYAYLYTQPFDSMEFSHYPVALVYLIRTKEPKVHWDESTQIPSTLRRNF